MTIKEFRKLKLDMALKLLGFSDVKDVKKGLSDSAGYMALRRIGKSLENFKNLRILNKYDIRRFASESATQGDKLDDIRDMLCDSIEELQADKKFIDAQDDSFYRTRDITPDFGLNMKKKVYSTDWELYSTVVQKTAKLYMGLYADLVNNQDGEDCEILTDLYGSELEDKISEVIDSKDFESACSIEDAFVIREYGKVLDNLNGMGIDDPNLQQNSVGIALEKIRREALASREERIKLDKKHQLLSKMYLAGTLKFQTPDKKGEDK